MDEPWDTLYRERGRKRVLARFDRRTVWLITSATHTAVASDEARAGVGWTGSEALSNTRTALTVELGEGLPGGLKRSDLAASRAVAPVAAAGRPQTQ